MNKLLVVVLVAAAGILGWLLLAKPEPVAVTGPAATAAHGAAATPAGRTGAGPAGGPATPAIISGAPAALSAGAGVDTAPGNAAPPPAAIGGAAGPAGGGVRTSAYGRTPGQGMAQILPGDLKASLRRYWGNLPKNGPLPAEVTAEQVFPPDLLRSLNIPPQSRVTMIGERKVTDRTAFEAVFNKPDDQMFMLGYSAIMPDGVEIRDYIRVQPPAPKP